MKLDSYGLNEANEALADVAEGRVLKALIKPSTDYTDYTDLFKRTV
jgi:hypothetical protein